VRANACDSFIIDWSSISGLGDGVKNCRFRQLREKIWNPIAKDKCCSMTCCNSSQLCSLLDHPEHVDVLVMF